MFRYEQVILDLTYDNKPMIFLQQTEYMYTETLSLNDKTKK